MSSSTALLLCLLLAALTLSLWMFGNPGARKAKRENLTLHCAASLKAPLEQACAEYERLFGARVSLQFGASQTLLSSLQVAKSGDLYLPADDSFISMARERKLVGGSVPLATQRPVLVIRKGLAAPATLADLLQPTWQIALPSAGATAIGKILQNALGARWAELEKHAVVNCATVVEGANAAKAGAANVTFIFDSMLAQYPELTVLPLAETKDLPVAHMEIAGLTCSAHPAEAQRFARWLSSRDGGLPFLKTQGMQVIDGDPWAETPELTLYAGSMLRPAIEQTLVDFEKAEGAKVTRIYNGCGILVGQMKAGSTPDAYFACDVEFMQQVQDAFEPRDDMAQNELVILVAKGNPKGVVDLKDLGREGLRIGVGHEKQCAMGWLTQRTFAESGVTDAVMKNVTVQSPTGDMLVNQMLTGSLDAAVTYLSNAIGVGDRLDALRIQGIKCSVATQPFAIAKKTTHKQLANRLHQLLRSAASKERFQDEGFQWR
jgi:molybdate transport system substrate-binding protein